jgi:hypothetical protein
VAVPHSITVDFGTTNCMCNDGRYRRGKIMVSYTGRYRDSGTVITYSFNNYAVSDHEVSNSSTKVVTNLGRNTNGNLHYSITESGSILKPNNGGTVTWASTRGREWIAGSNTILIWSDDEYLITGTANGTSAAGVTYSFNVTKALHIKLNCHNIVAGTVDITPAGKAVRTLDYGNGTCDNQATVTILSKTYNITLR